MASHLYPEPRQPSEQAPGSAVPTLSNIFKAATASTKRTAKSLQSPITTKQWYLILDPTMTAPTRPYKEVLDSMGLFKTVEISKQANETEIHRLFKRAFLEVVNLDFFTYRYSG